MSTQWHPLFARLLCLLLEDFYHRGDRQRLFLARIDFRL